MHAIELVNQAIAGNQPYIGKVICVGRNYAAHALELNNAVPTEPLLFIKSANSVVNFDQPLPAKHQHFEVHYELEIALLMGKTIKNVDAKEAKTAITGIGLALDLTLRDLQQSLKAQGYPWEMAKSFDHSCPITPFLNFADYDHADLEYQLILNHERRQHGKRSEMLFDFADLLAYASQHFSLCAGDIVLTGTPAGVGKLQPGDTLEAILSNKTLAKTTVI